MLSDCMKIVVIRIVSLLTDKSDTYLWGLVREKKNRKETGGIEIR